MQWPRTEVDGYYLAIKNSGRAQLCVLAEGCSWGLTADRSWRCPLADGSLPWCLLERGLGSSPQTSHGPPESVHRMAVSGTRQQAGSCRVSPDLVLEVTLHRFCCITLVTQAALATLGGTYVGGANARGCQSLGTVLKAVSHFSVHTDTQTTRHLREQRERAQKEKQRNSEKTICREQKKLKKKKRN